MTDNFALLDEPRRPWIDPEALKQKFLALSAQVHPDRVHNAPTVERQAADRRYSELNGAYNCLREPKERLRHLLELEQGTKPADIQNVPTETMDLFFETGRLCKEADAFLGEKARAASPILKAQLFERSHECLGKLLAMQQKINARRDELLAELKTMNPAWESTTNEPAQREPVPLPLGRLEEIYRLLGYFGRWRDQIQERSVRLSF
jgi:curved DNA-binding protein CbpA